LLAKCGHSLFFSNDGDTTSPSSRVRTDPMAATTMTAATMMMTTSGCRLIQKYLVIVVCSS
jgi:hypothetical protein